MRILVTGGAGFIGSHLVERLLASPLSGKHLDEIVVVDNLRRGRRAHLEPHLSAGRVRLLEGDIRDEATLAEALRGTEIVFHLAAQANVIGSEMDRDYAFSTNVVGTYNLLKHAADAGVRRIIFTSSREVYGDPATLPVPEDAPLAPKNAYGASKVAGEMYVRIAQTHQRLEAVILRLTNVYGPRDSERVIPLWIERARQCQDLLLYGGKQLIDFVWVGDVVEALVQAALAERAQIDGQTINVGTGISTPIAELAERILALSGSPSALRRLPARSVEVERYCSDVGRLSSLLGLHPEPGLRHLPAMVAAQTIPSSV